MFGFGGGKKKGKGGSCANAPAKKSAAQEEDDILRSMMVDPATLMKGIEEDPSLLAELAELGGDEDPELLALMGASGGAGAKKNQTMPAIPSKATAASQGSSRPVPKLPDKAPPKPSSAADAFLGNLHGGGGGGDSDMIEGLGLANEDDLKLDAADLDSSDLLAELGGLGWTEEHEAEHHLQAQQAALIATAAAKSGPISGSSTTSGSITTDKSSTTDKSNATTSTTTTSSSSTSSSGTTNTTRASSVGEGGGGEGGAEEVILPPLPKNEEHITDLEKQIQDCRLKAVALKKEGKTQEAVAEVKRLKALEAELGVRQHLAQTSVIAKSVQSRGSYGQEGEEGEGEEASPSIPKGEQEEKEGGQQQEEGGDPTTTPTSSTLIDVLPKGGSNSSISSSSNLQQEQTRMDQLREEIAKKRQQAAGHHKAGQSEEAMSFLREAKALEQEVGRLMKRASSRSVLQQKASPSASEEQQAGVKASSGPASPPPAPPVKDALTPLEEALIEAKKKAVQEALHLKNPPINDPKGAVVEYKKSKDYEKLLEELYERRKLYPGKASPAPFRWSIETRRKKKIIDLIPMDKLELTIHDGKEVLGVKRDKAAQHETVLVHYDLGFPKDAPMTGSTKTATTGPGAFVTFNHVVLYDLSRTRSTEQAFTRRHATFHIYRKKGFLPLMKQEELVSSCQVDLAALLDHCEVAEELPLNKEGTRRPVGGDACLKISMRMRVPLKENEWISEEIKTLVVGPWPSDPTSISTTTTLPASPAIPTTPSTPSTAAVGGGVSGPRPAASAATGGGGTTTPTPRPLSSAQPKQASPPEEKFAELTVLEKNEPLSVSLLISNDVLEYEIQLLTTSAAAASEMDENDRTIREAELNMKLNLLVLRVQREEITLEQYSSMLAERIKRDQLLAMYLSKQGKKPLALRVMKRVKLMEAELASAADAGEG